MHLTLELEMNEASSTRINFMFFFSRVDDLKLKGHFPELRIIPGNKAASCGFYAQEKLQIPTNIMNNCSLKTDQFPYMPCKCIKQLNFHF